MKFTNFHAISLGNVSYKLPMKIITSKLKNLIRRLITRERVGFVLYKLIGQNIIIVQEAMHDDKSIQLNEMIIKVDMANTIDKVSHDFLYKVPKKFIFSKC